MNRIDCSSLTVFFLGLILFCGSLVADVRLPSVIGKNMVLQQKSTVPIWGWAEPGEKITIKASWQSFKEYEAVTDTEGKWRVKIKTPKAGGPYILIIVGSNTIELKNILVGEVWVCSGQSNMQWPVKKSNDAEKEILAAEYPMIRLLNVLTTVADTPQDDCEAEWVECSQESISDFSAVGYFFWPSFA